MKKRTKLAVVSGTALALAAGGVGVAAATGNGGDDREAAIGGEALDKASSAALAHTGGGRVSDTEVGDEESYYEVEVTRADGSQVDVQLDRGFKVVSDETESEPDDG